MDLERSLANMALDEAPWRQHHDHAQSWNTGGPGGPSTAAQWGHLSPQQAHHQIRNVWQDPSTLAQNVNEALGLGGGGPGAPGWGGGQPVEVDFQSVKHIWQQQEGGHMDGAYNNPMHHQQRGMMNGMMGGDQNGDWMRPEANNALWSDPLKQEQEGYWKQPGGAGWNQQPGGPQGRWMGQGGAGMPGHVRNQPPPGAHMQRPPQVAGPHDIGGWNGPNGMMGGPPKQPMWDQRMRGMPGGQAPQSRRYPDVSVPPPMDMPALGLRGAHPQANPMWKSEPLGAAQNSIRPPQYGNNDFGGEFATPFMAGKPQGGSGQFPIGGADDLMWHDPNGELKKWQRDTGVSLWGDPDKACQRSVKYWMVPEGEEEELEMALLKCPVPQKKVEDENGQLRPAFAAPQKRPIIVTGWGELPENDPNNPVKPESIGDQKWGDSSAPSDSPWFLPGQQQSMITPQQDGGWSQPMQPGDGLAAGLAASSLSGAAPGTELIAEQLRLAVHKGYLDVSILSQNNLPPQVLNQMNVMLSKIPALESAESELNGLVDSVKPEGETGGNSPQRWMSDVQKVEHNRLIIEVTTARIEVTELSKKIHRALVEAGIAPSPEIQTQVHTQDPYYSFLE